MRAEAQGTVEYALLLVGVAVVAIVVVWRWRPEMAALLQQLGTP
jgi:hypothetical protein